MLYLSIYSRLMILSFPASNVEMMTKNRMSILLKTSWLQANQMLPNIRLSASHVSIPKPQEQSERSFQLLKFNVNVFPQNKLWQHLTKKIDLFFIKQSGVKTRIINKRVE